MLLCVPAADNGVDDDDEGVVADVDEDIVEDFEFVFAVVPSSNLLLPMCGTEWPASECLRMFAVDVGDVVSATASADVDVEVVTMAVDVDGDENFRGLLRGGWSPQEVPVDATWFVSLSILSLFKRQYF